MIACCIRSGVTLYTLIMVLYLYRVCRVPYGSYEHIRHILLFFSFFLALIAHRYNCVPPRCRTLQYLRTFSALTVSLWNDLADPVFDGVELLGFKSRAKAFLCGLSLSLSFCLPLYSLTFLSSICWYCGAAVFRLIECKSLSPSLALPTFNNNNSNNNNNNTV